MLINLKPRASRRPRRAQVIRRLAERARAGRRHHALHAAGAGPDHRGPGVRTQYQFVLRRRTMRAALDSGAAPGRALAADSPSSSTSPATCRTRGLQAFVEIDRDAAGRLGVSRRHRQRALQRLRPAPRSRPSSRSPTSTAWCWVGPSSLGPAALPASTPGPRAAAVPLSPRWFASSERHRAAGHQPCRPVPRRPLSFNLGPAPRWAKAVDAIESRRRAAGPAVASKPAFQGAALAFQSLSTNTLLLLILAAVVTMYIVLGVLYESYIHPVTILSTDPAVGRRRRAAGAAGSRAQGARRHRASSASSC